MENALGLLAAVLLAYWLLVILDPERYWPRGQLLRQGLQPPGEHGGWATVAVIIPARNEAQTLRRTLPSLISQEKSCSLIVVVDDKSTDGTGEAAREMAAISPVPEKVIVVEAEPLPPSWSGKVHALHSGVAIACRHMREKPEWLLFTDADILHPPGSIDALLARASDGPFDCVSVMARLHARLFWEKLLIPPFLYFFHFLYPFRKVSNPRSRAAAAAGGCILLRAEVLERIGGLAAIHDAVIDDVAMARRVKEVGGRCWLGMDPDILSIREYKRLGEIARMVARTAFTQLRFRFSLYLATLLFLGVLYVSPPLLAAAGLLSGSPFVTASSLLAWLLQSVTLAPFVIHERVGLAYAITLPLSALLYAWMTTLSVWRHFRGAGIEWRGRRL